jgi:hypothetical protein
MNTDKRGSVLLQSGLSVFIRGQELFPGFRFWRLF